jgi:hypothetical protein
MAESSMTDLMKWFSTPDRPVSISEFRQFWDSCSREEKDQYLRELSEIVQ